MIRLNQPFSGKTMVTQAAGDISPAKTLTAILSGLIALAVALPLQAASVMEEVVVTAQRTEESLQEVPIAVTAITGEMLEDKGIINPSDLQMTAPNVSFTATNFGGSSFSIRGIGRLVIAASGEDGVSTHINEIAIGTNLNTIEFFDVQRVEVLRGPQGTLFGRNSTGGSINMVTNMPDYDGIDGFADLEIGDYNHVRFKGAVNIPFSDTMGVRFAGFQLTRDGYIENLAAKSVSTIDTDMGIGASGTWAAGDLNSLKGTRLPYIDDDIDGRDILAFRFTYAWDFSDNGDFWVQYSSFDEDDDRARITNQVCKRTELPVHGCEPNGFGFESPHLTATTGGLFFALNGQPNQVRATNDGMPYNPTGAGGATPNFYTGTIQVGAYGPGDASLLYDHQPNQSELGLRTVFTDFEPVYMYEESLITTGANYEFGDFTLGFLGAYQETDFVAQTDYNVNVGNLLPASPSLMNPTFPGNLGQGVNLKGEWLTSAPAGGAGGDLLGNRGCDYQRGTAGVFGGCTVPGSGIRQFAMDQSSSESEGWTAEIRLSSQLDSPFNFQVGVSTYKNESFGDYYVNANSLDSVGLVGASGAGFPPLYPTMFNNLSNPNEPNTNEGVAFFAEAYYDITDRLKLTVGVRRNEDEKRIRDANAFVAAWDHEYFASYFLIPGTPAGSLVQSVMNTQENPDAKYDALVAYPSGLPNVNYLDADWLANIKHDTNGLVEDPLRGGRWGRLSNFLFGVDHLTRLGTINAISTAAGKTARQEAMDMGTTDMAMLNTIEAQAVMAAQGAAATLTAANARARAAISNDITIARFHGISQDDINAALNTPAYSEERIKIARQVGLINGFTETRVVTGSPTQTEFNATTGRIGLDFQLNDEMMIYGFFTRGYKPGGFNPPIATDFQLAAGEDRSSLFTFDSEEVDSFEVGFKSTIMDGQMILNGTAFIYDYTGLQVTRIRNNSSINENINADIMGLEIEWAWQPANMENFGMDGSIAWLDATVADAMSVDVLNKTAGNSEWIDLKDIGPGVLTATQFIAKRDELTPTVIQEAYGVNRAFNIPGTLYPDPTPDETTSTVPIPAYFSSTWLRGTNTSDVAGTSGPTTGPVTTSAGIPQNLDGNKLPNAPEFTMNLGMQYTWPVEAMVGDLTLRWDYYIQGDSFAREFNTVGDEIDGWDQHNLSLIYESTDGHWQARLWVRNLQDEDNVTGHYVTSDTSGYFRNYFLTEPQIFGLSIRYGMLGNM